MRAGVVAAVAGACVVGILGGIVVLRRPAADSRPVGSPLAFLAERDGTMAVWEWDGGRLHRVSPDGVHATSPAWDRCGRRLAYGGRTTTGTFAIYLVESGRPQLLLDTPGGVTSLAWAPDRDRLYAVLPVGDGRQRLVAINSATRTEQVLVERPTVTMGLLAVNPSSGEITVAELAAAGRSVLRRFDPDGRPLPDDDPSGFAPAWSPDGRRLAYVRDDPSGWVLAVRDADGAVEDLLHERRLVYAPAWSADGRRLSYERYEGEDPDIWSLDLAERRPSPALTGPGFDGAPAPQPACP